MVRPPVDAVTIGIVEYRFLSCVAKTLKRNVGRALPGHSLAGAEISCERGTDPARAVVRRRRPGIGLDRGMKWLASEVGGGGHRLLYVGTGEVARRESSFRKVERCAARQSNRGRQNDH